MMTNCDKCDNGAVWDGFEFVSCDCEAGQERTERKREEQDQEDSAAARQGVW